MKLTTLLLVGGMLALVAITGCTDKFSRPAYETLNKGMTQAEVKDILGSPDAKKDNVWRYKRNEPCEIAVIKFVDGKVSEKTWYESEEACKKDDNEPVECERESLNR